MQQQPRIAFFGTPDIAVWVLEALHDAGHTPELVVTNPDKPVGRKHIRTAPPAKQWAQQHGIPLFQPISLQQDVDLTPLTESPFDLFIVVAYGALIPQALIELPKYKTLNVHPSLLPLLRGASPIRSAILQDMNETGVTIMQMDAQMDHGPIVAQEVLTIPQTQWPIHGRALDQKLAQLGGALLVRTIPQWIDGSILPQEQDHEHATYCTKITKVMGQLDIDPFALPVGDAAYEAYLKICAFDGWPGTFFVHNNKRVKIVEASRTPDGALTIESVIPEGKKQCEFQQYLQSLR